VRWPTDINRHAFETDKKLYQLFQLYVFDKRNIPRNTLTRTEWDVAQFPSLGWIRCIAPDSSIPSLIRIAASVPSCFVTSVNILAVSMIWMTVGWIRCPSLTRSSVLGHGHISSVLLSSNSCSAFSSPWNWTATMCEIVNNSATDCSASLEFYIGFEHMTPAVA